MTSGNWYYVITQELKEYPIKNPIFFGGSSVAEVLQKFDHMNSHASGTAVAKSLSRQESDRLEDIITRDNVTKEEAKKNGYTNESIVVENGNLIFPPNIN